MSRFRRFTSIEAVHEAGFEPCHDIAAERFRHYGAPVYQRGALPILGTESTYFVASWAAKLINEWPLGSLDSAGDFDHYLLKAVIRRTVRSGDVDFATACCSVAMMSGAEALTAFMAARGLRTW